jgi:hypothetical protein
MIADEWSYIPTPLHDKMDCREKMYILHLAILTLIYISVKMSTVQKEGIIF